MENLHYWYKSTCLLVQKYKYWRRRRCNRKGSRVQGVAEGFEYYTDKYLVSRNPYLCCSVVAELIAELHEEGGSALDPMALSFSTWDDNWANKVARVARCGKHSSSCRCVV